MQKFPKDLKQDSAMDPQKIAEETTGNIYEGFPKKSLPEAIP